MKRNELHRGQSRGDIFSAANQIAGNQKISPPDEIIKKLKWQLWCCAIFLSLKFEFPALSGHPSVNWKRTRKDNFGLLALRYSLDLLPLGDSFVVNVVDLWAARVRRGNLDLCLQHFWNGRINIAFKFEVVRMLKFLTFGVQIFQVSNSEQNTSCSLLTAVCRKHLSKGLSLQSASEARARAFDTSLISDVTNTCKISPSTHLR